MRFLQRLPAPVLTGAAVVGVVVLVVLGIAAAGDDDVAPSFVSTPSSVVTRPAPEPPTGVTAQRYQPEDLGLALQVPSTWIERDGEEGYEAVVEAPNGGAFVLVDRRDITEGRGRVDELERLGATIVEERTTELDGRDAQLLRYEAPFPGRGIGTATEIDVDLGDGSFAIVVVASLDDADADPELLAWLVEAVRVTAR